MLGPTGECPQLAQPLVRGFLWMPLATTFREGRPQVAPTRNVSRTDALAPIYQRCIPYCAKPTAR